MEDGSVDPGQGFFRQRRNLIASALALFLTQLYDLKIATINFFGTIVIPDPDISISHILWAPFLYFAWRYSAYYRAAGASEKIQAVLYSHLHSSLSERADAKLRAILVTDARSLFSDSRWEQVQQPVETFGRVSIKGNNTWRWQFAICVKSTHDTSVIESEPITFSVLNLLLPNSKAFLIILARERVFSDFIFPSIVSALPIGLLYWWLLEA